MFAKYFLSLSLSICVGVIVKMCVLVWIVCSTHFLFPPICVSIKSYIQRYGELRQEESVCFKRLGLAYVWKPLGEEVRFTKLKQLKRFKFCTAYSITFCCFFLSFTGDAKMDWEIRNCVPEGVVKNLELLVWLLREGASSSRTFFAVL